MTIRYDGYEQIFLADTYQNKMRVDRLEKYRKSSLLRRVTDAIPEDAVSGGFTVQGLKDGCEAFLSMWSEFAPEQIIASAMSLDRLTGGAGILKIVKDKTSLSTECDPYAELEGLRVFKRSEITVHKTNDDPASPYYGQPETFMIRGVMEVHKSRLIILDGIKKEMGEDKLFGLPFVSDEVLKAIDDYNDCEEFASRLLRKKQVMVWSAMGLSKMCNLSSGADAVRLRMAQVGGLSSVDRPIGIDGEKETMELLKGDLSGVVDLLTQKIDRICMLTGIHEVKLKMRNTGGVSSSQNTALDTYNTEVRKYQVGKYRKILESLVPHFVRQEEWKIEFNPLSAPSAKEEAETQEIIARTITSLVGTVIDDAEARSSIRALIPDLILSDMESLPDEEVDNGENEPADSAGNDGAR